MCTTLKFDNLKEKNITKNLRSEVLQEHYDVICLVGRTPTNDKANSNIWSYVGNTGTAEAPRRGRLHAVHWQLKPSTVNKTRIILSCSAIRSANHSRLRRNADNTWPSNIRATAACYTPHARPVRQRTTHRTVSSHACSTLSQSINVSSESAPQHRQWPTASGGNMWRLSVVRKFIFIFHVFSASVFK